MRKFMIPVVALTTLAAVPFAAVVGAQAQQSSSGQAPSAQTESPAEPQITAVAVVDISELPQPTRDKVNAAVAKAKTEEIKALRDTIDANPPLVEALKKKGLTSANVIAANLDDQGRLTLITKKPS